MSISLAPLNAALNRHGWCAEWDSEDDFSVTIFRASTGHHDAFCFNPSDPYNNNPWDEEGAVHGFDAINDPAVEKALFALCKACQE